ncbi:MAG: hypothetical protein SGJ24_12445 [Chloroflexota bacterium]|nr:hypothetical protein [Chloroflexota bacterium]
MIETKQVKIVAGADNADRARAWADRLRERDIDTALGTPVKGDIVVAILSRADARSIPADVIAALDLGLQLIVLKTEPFDVPKLIDHVLSIDAIAPGALDRLIEQIALASTGEASLPLKVLTPNARRTNRSAGIFVGGLAVMMFAVGIVGVGVFGLQRPNDEYDDIDTEVALTRDYFVGPELLYFSTWLPRSTEDAANYQATLQQLPTAWRPLMGLTVTAYARGTPLPPITTPVPEGQ